MEIVQLYFNSFNKLLNCILLVDKFFVQSDREYVSKFLSDPKDLMKFLKALDKMTKKSIPSTIINIKGRNIKISS